MATADAGRTNGIYAHDRGSLEAGLADIVIHSSDLSVQRTFIGGSEFAL